jgi:hypothetical protein
MTDKFQCNTCSFKGNAQKCQPLYDALKTAGDYRKSEKDEAIELLEQCTSIIPCNVYSDEKVKNSDDNEWDTLPEDCFSPLNESHDTPSNEPLIKPLSTKSTKSGSNHIAVIARVVFILFIVGIVIGSSPSTLSSITALVGQTPTINVVGGVGGIPEDVFGGDIMHQTIKNATGVDYVTQTEEYRASPQTIVYPYVLNGNRKSISFTTYGGLNNYLSMNEPPSYNSHDDFIKRLTLDTEQDTYFKPLLDEIKKQSPNKDDQAKIAISIVQNIPYNYARADNITKKQNTSWQYPYETIYLNSGVCIDKSLLLIYLLNKLGYDAVLFEFDQENHAAVGIKTNPEYMYKHTGYAFIETTRPTIITDSSGRYGINSAILTSTPAVTYLTNGNETIEVSQEYKDAKTYNELTATQQKLQPLIYRQLELIIWKYGLKDKMDGQYVTEDPANKPLCPNKGQLCNGECYVPCPRGTGTCTRNGVVCQ